MGNTITVDFHGDRLLGIETQAGAFVYLKPIVERLGLDWSAQLKRVKRDQTLREGMAIMATPPDFGGGNEAVFLRLDLLHGWLFTVSSARVREDLRPKFIVYQRECYAALAKAFGREERAPDAARGPIMDLPTAESRKLVSECRTTFGVLAARELWFVLGLPRTPSMYGGPPMPLFTYTATKQQGA